MNATRRFNMQRLETGEQISFSPLLRRYSLDEFWALPEPQGRAHYDLIGGYLFMVPPPEPPHGTIDSRLKRLLIQFLIEHDIRGEVHHPREAIFRHAEEGDTYLEPDMMYVSDELSKSMGHKRTSADIVFEYLSESTRIYDQTTKAHTYLALGVRELWLVDPVASTIEVRYVTDHEGQYSWESRLYSNQDWAQSKVLAGWRISVAELFEGLP